MEKESQLQPISESALSAPLSPLEIAGQAANRAAGKHIFRRYLSEKSVNSIKRHARDLELFAEYLIDGRIPLHHGADYQTNPNAWRGVTWGIVEGFGQWLLHEGYAISTVNARLSTVRIYALMAVKAGVIERQEGALIQTVKGFSRAGGQNVDERREQTRKRETTYVYKLEGAKKSVVVTRRSTKKATAAVINEQTAVLLKTPRNASPQAYRDALLMCILLDHGLRVSEVVQLTPASIKLNEKLFRFHRPKVKGTAHAWATHQLTEDTARIGAIYLNRFYPDLLKPDGALILATTRLLRNGEGGHLLGDGMNRVRLSERVAWLGRKIGVEKISAHDCRHYCATKMSRLGYGVDELMAWFGWTSAQTAMRYVTAVDIQKRTKG